MTEIHATPRKAVKTAILEVEGRIVGRDRKIIDPQQVETLAGLGCKESEIAVLLGIDKNTLRYNFKTELEKGQTNLKMSLRRKQIEVALDGNVTMLIWLGKNMLGQSDNPTAGEDTAPLPWTDEDL